MHLSAAHRRRRVLQAAHGLRTTAGEPSAFALLLMYSISIGQGKGKGKGAADRYL